MKPILVGSCVVVGLGLVGFLFTNQASPYVDVATAKGSKADNMHVAGKIVPGSLTESMGRAAFLLVDDKGSQMPVQYQGEPLSNLGQSEKVVAIGGMEGDTFKAHKMLVKCPSKYTSTPTSAKV